MNSIKYDKLVRDRIPNIIEGSGKKCVTEILSDEDYKKYLDKKLREEFEEYMESKEIVELADMVEVIRAIIKSKGLSLDDFERIIRRKSIENGSFDDKILLKEVTE